MNCGNCGKEFLEGDKFCRNCGAAINVQTTHDAPKKKYRNRKNAGQFGFALS